VRGREEGERGGRWRATWAGSELGRDEKKGGSWAAVGKRKETEVRWAAGLGWANRVCFLLLFFLFSFYFQIHFKTNFKPFKFKSFTCFQILTQISPTI
jgi:hypothetical protein